MGECANICANRGGVKSCVVTRSSRSTIVNGYPTKEPYTVPGSMNCVYNKPDGESFCSRNTAACVVGGICALYIFRPVIPILGGVAVSQ